MDFYSARLLFLMLNQDNRPRKKNLYDESIVVFRARDFEHALERALELGSERSEGFTKFVEVLTLDWIGKKVDGAEVASKLHYRTTDRALSRRTRFRPEKSKPEGSF